MQSNHGNGLIATGVIGAIIARGCRFTPFLVVIVNPIDLAVAMVT